MIIAIKHIAPPDIWQKLQQNPFTRGYKTKPEKIHSLKTLKICLMPRYKNKLSAHTLVKIGIFYILWY